MVELVLTGPYTCISAEGCFAIQIEIPDDDAGSTSSTIDASVPIEWEWDCYDDPKYAAEVDKPPVTQLISDSRGSRKVAEVTYAVMSNAREATVQVKFRLKDWQIAARIGGEVTAHIDGFEDKYRSVLFRCAMGTRRYFSHTGGDSWFHLELARNVVAVPCGSALEIGVKLHIETAEGKKVECNNVFLCFSNGISSSKTDDGNEIEVEMEVTWYPEIAQSSKPPRTSKEGDEEQFTTAPLEQSGPAEVKLVSENYATEIVYTIGDELSFVSFIMDLRRKLAEHQEHEDILDGHGLLNLSSSTEHPVLAKQRPIQPARWVHIKLQVVKGKKTSWITLLMRDDNLYVHGFINKQGVCYQLCDRQQNAWTNILPSTYSPIQLYWGLSYRSLLGTRTSNGAVVLLADAHLGRNFARQAVRRLSSLLHRDGKETPGMMSPRLALSGLILMVCESARMNPLLDFFVRGWSAGTRFTEELMDRYVSKYADMSSQLMTWKSGCYAKSHPIKELQAVYLVLNTMSIRFDKTEQQHQRWKRRSTGSGWGGTSHSRGGISIVGKGGGGKRKWVAYNDGSSGGPKSPPLKKYYNASSSAGPTCKSEEATDAGRSGGPDSKSEESSEVDSTDSADSQSEEFSDAVSPGRSEETSDDSASSGGNSIGQPWDGLADDETHCLGRPRVELLSMRADLGIVGQNITVFDGKRGQIIHRNEKQGEQGRMVDLVLTGPCTGISGYGCFAIIIDIPDAAPIEWVWDCYDQKYANQVDGPPRTHTILNPTNDDNREVAEVTYVVMSRAREATVQVMLRPKDMANPGGIIIDEITAIIEDFKDGEKIEDKHKSVLFSHTSREKDQTTFPTTKDNSWYLVPLTRNVIAVPCGSWLYIEVKLLIITDDSKQVPLNVPLSFENNGICSTKSDNANEVEVQVEITWYPEVIPEVKMANEVVYKIGDEKSYTEFILALRHMLADHPDREDVLDCHYSSILSSTREHPVLAKQLAEQPARWIHVKLHAEKGEEMLSTTLIMRDDNLYVCGFMNQQGDSFELIERPDRSANILPVEEYNPRRLSWGVGYRSLLDADTADDLTRVLSCARFGRYFATKAVHVLSCFPAWADGNMNPRMALAGLIVMVCESARMKCIHDFIEGSWSNNGNIKFTDGLMLMRDSVLNYWRMSRELLTWKTKRYTPPNPTLQRQQIYLVLNSPMYDPPRQSSSMGRGRPRVELLTMHADYAVVGTTITVFDGKQGHIIYRKEEPGAEKGRNLVLTGPYAGISAHGCFAIKIDIPRPHTSTGDDAGDTINWVWDCYNPKHAKQVDQGPKTGIIDTGRNIKVTYAVMSNVYEARVQVKLWLRDGNSSHCSVHGHIAARIANFKYPITLFSRTREKPHRFARTEHSNVLQVARSLKLARNLVAVPLDQTLHVVGHLVIQTSNEQRSNRRVIRFHPRFENGILSDNKDYPVEEVEVTIACYPDIRPSRPSEMEEKRQRQPDIWYKIGEDAQGFNTFITELRRLVAEHPRCKKLMADHPQLSSPHNHPVLPKGQRLPKMSLAQIKPERLFHINLEAVDKTTVTLVIRDDSLDVIGFINQNEVCYELGEAGGSPQLSSEKNRPKILPWGMDAGGRSQAEHIMGVTKTPKVFAEDAVQCLSSFKDEGPSDQAKRSLVGLMILVCESVRMEPSRQAVAAGWNTTDGTSLSKKEPLKDWSWMWPIVSGALLDWRDHDYKKWPKNKKLEDIKIMSPEEALEVVPIVFNDEDRIWDYKKRPKNKKLEDIKIMSQKKH